VGIHKVILEKIKSSHDNLRTNAIKGICVDWPVIGKPFVLYSKDVLTKDTNLRCIKTSIVKEVTRDVIKNSHCEITFTTENSKYILKTKL